MEFKELAEIKQRLCSSYINCDDCVLHKVKKVCDNWCWSNPEEFETKMIVWAQEHPENSNESYFLTLFPDSPWQYFCGKGDCETFKCISIGRKPCSMCSWWYAKHA